MKKIICFLSALVCLFQTNADISLVTYREKSKNFDPSTDLIRGIVLLSEGTLLEQRHYGNIKFHGMDKDEIDANICSFMDKGLDGTAQLLVLTHPSTGISGLNADGKGSLIALFRDDENEKNVHVRLVAHMFKIANQFRKAMEKEAKVENIQIVKDIAVIREKKAEAEKKLEDIQNERKELIEQFKLCRDEIFQEMRDIRSFLREHESESNLIKNVIGYYDNFLGDTKKKKNKEKVINNRLNYENRSFSDDLKSLERRFASCDKIMKIIGREDIEREQRHKELIEKLKSTADSIKTKNDDMRYVQIQNADIAKDDCIAFAGKYFGLKKMYFYGASIELNRKRREVLFDLGSSIVESILLENQNTEMKDEDNIVFDYIKEYEGEYNLYADKENVDWKHPYPFGYTNDIICAYAWQMLDDSDLDTLAAYLFGDKKRSPYQSSITEIIYKTAQIDKSVVPFFSWQKIISNGTTFWKGESPFADCIETLLRQFFALIFSSKKSEDGKEILKELRLAKERIPVDKDGKTTLKDFFEMKKSIRLMANDANSMTRTRWAEICGNKNPIIKYNIGNHDVSGSWENVIKLFCLLMINYPQLLEERTAKNITVTEREKAAAARIKEINKLGEKQINKKNIIDILNDLLGIRTDVKLVAEYVPDDLNAISIYPEDEESDINKLVFVVNGHGYVKDIDLSKDFSCYSMPKDLPRELKNTWYTLKKQYVRKSRWNENFYTIGTNIDSVNPLIRYYYAIKYPDFHILEEIFPYDGSFIRANSTGILKLIDRQGAKCMDGLIRLLEMDSDFLDLSCLTKIPYLSENIILFLDRISKESHKASVLLSLILVLQDKKFANKIKSEERLANIYKQTINRLTYVLKNNAGKKEMFLGQKWNLVARKTVFDGSILDYMRPYGRYLLDLKLDKHNAKRVVREAENLITILNLTDFSKYDSFWAFFIGQMEKRDAYFVSNIINKNEGKENVFLPYLNISVEKAISKAEKLDKVPVGFFVRIFSPNRSSEDYEEIKKRTKTIESIADRLDICDSDSLAWAITSLNGQFKHISDRIAKNEMKSIDKIPVKIAYKIWENISSNVQHQMLSKIDFKESSIDDLAIFSDRLMTFLKEPEIEEDIKLKIINEIADICQGKDFSHSDMQDLLIRTLEFLPRESVTELLKSISFEDIEDIVKNIRFENNNSEALSKIMDYYLQSKNDLSLSDFEHIFHNCYLMENDQVDLLLRKIIGNREFDISLIEDILKICCNSEKPNAQKVLHRFFHLYPKEFSAPSRVARILRLVNKEKQFISFSGDGYVYKSEITIDEEVIENLDFDINKDSLDDIVLILSLCHFNKRNGTVWKSIADKILPQKPSFEVCKRILKYFPAENQLKYLDSINEKISVLDLHNYLDRLDWRNLKIISEKASEQLFTNKMDKYIFAGVLAYCSSASQKKMIEDVLNRSDNLPDYKLAIVASLCMNLNEQNSLGDKLEAIKSLLKLIPEEERHSDISEISNIDRCADLVIETSDYSLKYMGLCKYCSPAYGKKLIEKAVKNGLSESAFEEMVGKYNFKEATKLLGCWPSEDDNGLSGIVFDGIPLEIGEKPRVFMELRRKIFVNTLEQMNSDSEILNFLKAVPDLFGVEQSNLIDKAILICGKLSLWVAVGMVKNYKNLNVLKMVSPEEFQKCWFELNTLFVNPEFSNERILEYCPNLLPLEAILKFSKYFTDNLEILPQKIDFKNIPTEDVQELKKCIKRCTAKDKQLLKAIANHWPNGITMPEYLAEAIKD